MDVVSGATHTSKAIIEAAKKALAESGKKLTDKIASVEQNMTPGTYYGEVYGKWKEGTIEGERFGSPKVIKPTNRWLFDGHKKGSHISVRTVPLFHGETRCYIRDINIHNIFN